MTEAQRKVFADLGCIVEDATPDLNDADEVFRVLRAWAFELSFNELLRKHRPLMKDTVIWNIEQGSTLTGPQIGGAEIKRTQIYHRMREFMETYDYLVAPVAQVLPFDIGIPFVTGIGDIQFETYLDWMKSCYLITVTGAPTSVDTVLDSVRGRAPGRPANCRAAPARIGSGCADQPMLARRAGDGMRAAPSAARIGAPARVPFAHAAHLVQEHGVVEARHLGQCRGLGRLCGRPFDVER